MGKITKRIQDTKAEGMKGEGVIGKERTNLHALVDWRGS